MAAGCAASEVEVDRKTEKPLWRPEISKNLLHAEIRPDTRIQLFSLLDNTFLQEFCSTSEF